MPDGQTIRFSPELNTLIGARGSSKSSILEAIRYAFDIPFGERALDPERRYCSRNSKWDPSDFGCTKLGDGHGLRRPAFVLRPSRHALRAAPGLP